MKLEDLAQRITNLENDMKLVRDGSLESKHFYDRGDPSDYDFSLTDLTTDGNFHDLNLSSVVPNGAKAVLLYVMIRDNLVDSYIYFRKNGSTNNKSRSLVRTSVANQNNDADMIVPCDDNRIIEYNASNTTFANIDITIKGWWK